MKTKNIKLSPGFWMFFIPSFCFSQVIFHRQQDVIYGYKDGMALVMDVYYPNESANNSGIIVVMAGGMASSPIWSHKAGNRSDVQNLLKAGYVVFAVAHSSQPKYTADESREDIPRAVRFIRYNSERFGIDPNSIGILGYSSGGHVSLMTALASHPENQKSDDPVDNVSPEVQAAVAYYPSSDLVNFGQDNVTILEYFHSVGYQLDAAFDFHRWDNESNRFERIVNPETVREYYIKNSPINHVTDDDPPILIIHGTEDNLVPIQQSEIVIDKLKENGVPCKLLAIPGAGHGWKKPIGNEYAEVTDWFKRFLPDTSKNLKKRANNKRYNQ